MSATSEKRALIFGLLCSIVAAATPTYYTPPYRSVFKSFGAELPFLTTVFTDYHQAFWILPFAVLGIWMFWPKPAQRGRAACLSGIVSLVLVVPATVFAMYLPTFMPGHP